ncbi:MAG: hypothetical protein ACOY4I_09950 [Bacillota bacterium]
MRKNTRISFFYRTSTVFTIIIFILVALIPGQALAFDLKAGAKDTLDLIKIFVMIAVLASAMWTFFRSQLTAAIVIIIVGAVLLAMTTPGLMETVGKGFLNLLGGGS